MKKIIIFVICILFVFSLFSCKKKSSSEEVITGTLGPIYSYKDEIITAYYQDDVSDYPGNIERSEFSPNTRFFVLSDFTSKQSSFANAYDIFTSSCNDSASNDVIALIGGLSNPDNQNSLTETKNCIDTSLSEDPIIFPIPDATDLAVGLENVENILQYPINRHVIINEFHFISIRCDEDSTYRSSVEWLGAELESAYSNDSEMAIVVAAAAPITDELDEILKQYPSVVLITPEKSDDGIVKHDEYTHIFAASDSSMFAFEFDTEGRMLIKEVDMSGNIIKNEDGSDAEYFIQTPWDATSF